MNLSAASVYDNLNSPDVFSKSRVYQNINDLLSINGNVEIKIFCPLCMNSFEYKFSLFEHLRTCHNNFLLQTGNQTLEFVKCPFCNARFYGKHITVKHALLYHSEVIRELFVNKNETSKCFFCSETLNKNDSESSVKHIEELHFLEFEEQFKKMYLTGAMLEMTMSDLVNSSIQDDNSPSGSETWKDICVDVGINHSKITGSDAKDFPEASKINCYDFTDLKKQLESIKDVHSSKKPILKNVKNTHHSPKPQKSVRRVLRFDLPHCNEDKENSVLKQNLETFKQINVDEHILLCKNSKNEMCNFFKNSGELPDNFYGEPQHSSTPNFNTLDSKINILGKDESKRKGAEQIKTNFKSYLFPKSMPQFDYQCGKCRKLFKENLDLVFHVKKSHKKFSLNVLQPSYRCAICYARFYKNYYLRKHHILHKPY